MTALCAAQHHPSPPPPHTLTPPLKRFGHTAAHKLPLLHNSQPWPPQPADKADTCTRLAQSLRGCCCKALAPCTRLHCVVCASVRSGTTQSFQPASRSTADPQLSLFAWVGSGGGLCPFASQSKRVLLCHSTPHSNGSSRGPHEPCCAVLCFKSYEEETRQGQRSLDTRMHTSAIRPSGTKRKPPPPPLYMQSPCRVINLFCKDAKKR